MIVYGGLAMIFLVAGFGLGWYEYDLRWKIAHAVHRVRPEMQVLVLFSRARSLRTSSVHRIYREHYPDGRLAQWHVAFAIASPLCFLAFAALLALAIRHS
jgi:cobalamin synthase